jgi:hypothetical protein
MDAISKGLFHYTNDVEGVTLQSVNIKEVTPSGNQGVEEMEAAKLQWNRNQTDSGPYRMEDKPGNQYALCAQDIRSFIVTYYPTVNFEQKEFLKE